MIYGYGRISTLDRTEHKYGKQLIDSQLKELKRLGANVVMYDEESGLKENRKELKKLLEIVKEGDSIICVEASRITRSVKQLCDILELAQKRKIKIQLGSLVVDFTKEDVDPMSVAVMKLITIFSELEAELIRNRVLRGIYYAKNVKKVKLGRPKTTYDTIPDLFFKYLPMYTNNKINKSELARLSGLSYPTIYKYLDIVKRR